MTDPYGWLKDTASECLQVGSELKQISSFRKNSSETLVTAVDSFDPLMTHKGSIYTCQVLNKLRGKKHWHASNCCDNI